MRGVCHRPPPLCHTFSSSKRLRPFFRPFAGPASLTRESAQFAGNARGAVLSTPESANTATDRPLQELLRDQLHLHQLQRAGVPEEQQAEKLSPSQAASSDQTPDSVDSSAKQAVSSPGKAKARRSRKSRSSASNKQRDGSPVTVPNADGQAEKATASSKTSRRSKPSGTAKQKPAKQSLDSADPAAAQQVEQAAAAAVSRSRSRRRSNSKSRAKQSPASGSLDKASVDAAVKPAQASTPQAAAAKTPKQGLRQNQVPQATAAKVPQQGVSRSQPPNPNPQANRPQASQRRSSPSPAARGVGRSTRSDVQVRTIPSKAISTGQRQALHQAPSQAKATAAKRARYYSNPLASRENQMPPRAVQAAPAQTAQQPSLLNTAGGEMPKDLSVEEDCVLCSAIQDAAYLERQRRLIYSPKASEMDASLEESTDQLPEGSAVAAAAPAIDKPIQADDYQRLKQWKDAVGAQTFQQLHQRLDRGERAKQMLLHYHRGLVRSFVWRVKSLGSEFAFQELMAVGEEALLKAASRYDASQGAKFSTFAYLIINRAISRYMMEHEDVVRVPVSLKELSFKITQATAKLQQEWSRAPTPQEIAREVDQPLSRVVLSMGNSKNPVSIDAQPDDEEKDSLVDMLAASIDEPADDSPSVKMSQSKFTSDIENVLESLPEREGEVIAMRYGIFTSKPQTLASIAQLFGLSQEAIRKTELSAFRTLRETGHLHSLLTFLREVEVQESKPTLQPANPMR